MMKNKWMRKRKAQSALFDGILFFLLMLISTTIVIYYTASTQAPRTQSESQLFLREYCEDTLTAVLAATINDTSYIRPSDGAKVILEDQSVEELILEDLYIRYENDPLSPANALEKLETDISSLVFELTHVNQTLLEEQKLYQESFHYRLYAEYRANSKTVSMDLWDPTWQSGSSTKTEPKTVISAFKELEAVNEHEVNRNANATVYLKIWKNQ